MLLSVPERKAPSLPVDQSHWPMLGTRASAPAARELGWMWNKYLVSSACLEDGGFYQQGPGGCVHVTPWEVYAEV